MAIGNVIAQLRQERNMSQAELAEKLYVTRQAVSRWENGDTTPSIDMVKLLAFVFEIPVSCLLEMPEWPICQSCGMPLVDHSERAEDADGSTTDRFCKHCYHRGKYRYDGSMDDLIESCAKYTAEHTGMSIDEAVSYMGAFLPLLDRWKEGKDGQQL